MTTEQPKNVVFLSNVRLSFPNLVEPQEKVTDDGKKRISYNCEALMPPDHPAFTQFMQTYATMAQEKWKEHANAVMQMIHADRKSRCYGYGAEKVNKKSMKVYDGYVDQVFISMGRDTPPQVIQPDGRPLDPANTMAYRQLTMKMYGGCRVNLAVRPWLQENKHGRGVRCDLIAVQFCADDKPFGEGNIDASGMFGQVAAPAAGPSPAGASLPLPGMPSAAAHQPFPLPGAAMPPPPTFGAGAPPLPPFLTK
jgi:ATP-dependent Clp protease adapter protein ClpS